MALREFGDVGSQSDDETLDAQWWVMCWLCQKCDLAVVKTYHKVWFHSKCPNAVFARHRQFRIAAETKEEAQNALKEDQQQMVGNAGEWRPKVLPYAEGGTRAKAIARAEARDEVHTHVT